MKLFFRRKFYFLIIITISLAGFYFIKTNYWAVAEAIPKTQRREIKLAMNSLKDLPYLLHQFLPSKLDTYELLIQKKNVDKLARDLPEDENIKFDASDMDFVDADFLARGEMYKVKVKYRGSTSQHWAYPKKSVRVKFIEPQFFNSMSEINLVVPESRGYLMEAFNNYRAKKLGLPHIKDDFVNLKINGEAYGVYYLFEGWTKEFLERDNQLTADTNLYGEKNFDDNLYENPRAWTKYASDPYKDKNDVSELEIFLKIINVADSAEFYSKIDTILDLENFLTWNAHSFLSGSFHQDFKHNARLYFDPAIGKFKFIPWQVLGWTLEELGDITYNPLVRRVLSNPESLTRRNKALWQYVSREKNLKEDLAFYDDLAKRLKRDLLQDRKKQESNRTVLQKIAGYRKTIERNFNFIKDNYFDTVMEWASGPGGGSYLAAVADVQSRGPAPLAVSGARIKVQPLANEDNLLFYLDSNQSGIIDAGDERLGRFTLGASGTQELLFTKPFELMSKIDFDYDKKSRKASFIFLPSIKRVFVLSENRIAEKYKDLEIIFKAKNLITGDVVTAARKNYLDEGAPSPAHISIKKINDFFSQYPQFRKGAGNTAVLESGSYYFKETVVVPKELNLAIKPGANIFMGKGASLVAHGGVSLEGRAASPIYFRGVSKDPWGSFAVIDSGEPVNIFYTVFDGGGGSGEFTSINGARLTGMVAVHDVPEVNISFSKFLNARGGDDALNIKYGKVKITDSEFRGNHFDALDLDFVQGEVLDNKFKNNANDGIDISGSQLVIARNFIEGAGDKGISVGERSEPEIKDNTIINGNTGIAIKDASEAKIINNTIYKNKIGLAAYQKKDFFGGGRAEVSESVIWKNEKQFELDSNSSFSVTNSNIEGGHEGAGNYSKDPGLKF